MSGGAAARAARERAGPDVTREGEANCFGVTSRGRAQIRGLGVLALGSGGLAFVFRLGAKPLFIPRASIRRVTTKRGHLGKTVGRTLLEVFFVDEAHRYDSVGFLLSDLEAWRAELEGIAAENAQRVGRTETRASPLAPSVEGQAMRVPRVGPLAWAALVGGVFLTSAMPAFLETASYIGLGVATLAVLGTTLRGWWAQRRAMKAAPRYAAGAEGLFLDGKRLCERWELTTGVVVPVPHGALLTLTRRGMRRPIVLKVASLAEGRELLDALGLGAAQRALTRKVASALLTRKGLLAALAPAYLGLPLGVLLGWFVSRGLGLTVAGGGALVTFLLFYTLGFIKTKITVGADGVRATWLWREKLIELGSIARVYATRVRRSGHSVRLELHDGSVEELLVGAGSSIFTPFDAVEETSVLVERVRAALALRGPKGELDVEAWLERRGTLSVSDWVRELRLTVRAQLREGIDDVGERLLSVIEASELAPAVRVAAAVAIGPALAERGRGRLRAAAKASAVPQVRVALEAAAEDRDADLVQAFAELSDAHRVRVRVADDAQRLADAEAEVEALLVERPGSAYRTNAKS